MKTRSITKVTLLSIFVMSVITAITLNSCQKENIKPKAVNTSSRTNGIAIADVSSNLVIDEANSIMFSSFKNEKGLGLGGFDSSSCLIRTFDTVAKPYTVTYDYGSGCLGSDGKTRAGKAICTYNSTDIKQVNAAMSVSFQNYSINGDAVNGSVSLINNGPNANNNQVLSETASYIITKGSNVDTTQANLQIEWLAGEYSSPAANWQFSLTGAAHTGISNGQYATVTITTPLIRNAKTPGCNYYIQGTEQIDVNGSPIQYVDFGNPGGCSGQQSVTQNGVTTIQPQGH